MTAWPLAVWVVAASLEDGRRADPGTKLQRARGLSLLLLIAGSTLGSAAVLPLVAVALAVTGLALRLWTIHTLGNAFVASPVPMGPRRNDGPFAWVRHPSDTGLVAMATATWMLGGCSLWAAPALVLLVGLTAMQIRDEEHWLEGAVSDQLPAISSDGLTADRCPGPPHTADG